MALDPIFIAEIARDGLIEDRTFNSKRIMGPAVLLPDAIEVVRCKFRNCTFENIGWASRNVKELRDQVGWMYDNDPPSLLTGTPETTDRRGTSLVTGLSAVTHAAHAVDRMAAGF